VGSHRALLDLISGVGRLCPVVDQTEQMRIAGSFEITGKRFANKTAEEK
jgi:hypothetical protein